MTERVLLKPVIHRDSPSIACSAWSSVVSLAGYKQLLYFRCLPSTRRKYSVGTCQKHQQSNAAMDVRVWGPDLCYMSKISV